MSYFCRTILFKSPQTLDFTGFIYPMISLSGFNHCIYVQSLLSPHNPVPIVFLTHRKHTIHCNFSSIPNALESKLESWRIGEKAGFPMNCKEKRAIHSGNIVAHKALQFKVLGCFRPYNSCDARIRTAYELFSRPPHCLS